MRLNGFDLNQLVCLQALLAERSVTRAAQNLRLSQSAMSTVLGQLRRHFNDELLVRSGRTLLLTPFAKTLIAPLSELMAKAQSFATLMPDLQALDVERELTILASDYATTTFLAEAVRVAHEEMPGLRFDILPLSTASAQLLSRGEADLLFAGETLDVGVAPRETLFEDNFVCVLCNESNPRTRRLTVDEYLSRRHVVVRYFEHQMPFVDEDALRRAGLNRQRDVAVWSFSLVPHLICGTTMIATIASLVAKGMQHRWPITIVPFPFEHQPVRLYAYWHPSRDHDPVLAAFMAIVRKVLETSRVRRAPPR